MNDLENKLQLNVSQKQLIRNTNWKHMKITKSGHKKRDQKNGKRKIYEENLQLYDLVEKATEKLLSQISNFHAK